MTKKGILWPEEIAPFDDSSFRNRQNHKTSSVFTEKEFIRELEKASLEFLYDDREGVFAGEKIYRCRSYRHSYNDEVVSEKTHIAKKLSKKKRPGKNRNPKFRRSNKKN